MNASAAVFGVGGLGEWRSFIGFALCDVVYTGQQNSHFLLDSQFYLNKLGGHRQNFNLRMNQQPPCLSKKLTNKLTCQSINFILKPLTDNAHFKAY